MAELIISSVVENLLGKISSIAYQEVCLAWGVKTELEKLKDTLSTIKSVLLDAEEKQVHSHELRNWLEKLKNACYDAEDVLDEFVVEALRRQVINQQNVGRKVHRFFSSSNPVVFRFRMGHKIKQIMKRFNKIATTKAKFNLTVVVDSSHAVLREREMTHSFVVASEIVGRDDDKENIIRLLMNSESSYDETVPVIPIVGIGGLGKTALAKLVYNNEWVSNNFELKVWICVSDGFDLKELVVKILKSVLNENLNHLDIDQLIRILVENLRGKKYLLVLDDVWNDDHKKWIELKEVLTTGAQGSKIIVTTRSDKVASIVGTILTYKLRGLSNEECLDLFIKYAFRKGEEKQHSNLTKIGKKIVEKCKGVPLAVKTLGSLLYSSIDERDWKNVMDSGIWNLEQQTDDILHALRLSYDHLPHYLRKCFVYCCLFPKDYEFADYTLIQFWMTHGLLQSSYENQDLENIGMQYLKELASRSFFQDFEKRLDVLYYFKMHDLMHDLAMSLMASECLMVRSINQTFSKTVRHLSFVDNEMHEKDLPSFLSNLGHVRSINFFKIDGLEARKSFLESCISRFQLLRVLNLRDAGIKVLPNKIGNLKHLRYLDLTNNGEIEELPSSFFKLQSLQTLILYECNNLEEIPTDIRYLINLKCLGLTTKQRFLSKNGIGCLNSLRYLIIAGCYNLEYLFEDIGHLKCLHTLIIGECPRLISLPCGVKYLSSLENLLLAECERLNLDLGKGTEGEDNAQDRCTPMPHLRYLGIFDLPQVVELPQWLLQAAAKTLQFLGIWSCPELGERYDPNTGEDWSKIAHIPTIQIGKKIIESSSS